MRNFSFINTCTNAAIFFVVVSIVVLVHLSVFKAFGIVTNVILLLLALPIQSQSKHHQTIRVCIVWGLIVGSIVMNAIQPLTGGLS